MLGFIKRNIWNFVDPITIKILYIAYVSSVLEYASIVWSPYYSVHEQRIESVQRRFLRYALQKLPSSNNSEPLPYESRLALLNMKSLRTRRKVNSALFIRDILCKKLATPALFSLLNMREPTRELRSSLQL